MKALLLRSRQPSTIAGISALIATLLGLALNQLTWAQALPVLVGAAASIILPDNTQAVRDAESLAADIVARRLAPPGQH